MRQGLAVIDGGRPLSISSRADLRLVGAQGEDEIRQVIYDIAESMTPRPNAELFKAINPKRARGNSLTTVITGVATLARDRRLTMPQWNRIRGTINGVLDALVIELPRCLPSIHLEETIDEGASNVAELALRDAYIAGNVPEMRRLLPAVDQHTESKQRFAALVRARIRECSHTMVLTSRGLRA